MKATAQLIVNGRPIPYDTVPVRYMADGMRRYFEHGIPSGSFGHALLCNDLRETFARAELSSSARGPPQGAATFMTEVIGILQQFQQEVEEDADTSDTEPEEEEEHAPLLPPPAPLVSPVSQEASPAPPPASELPPLSPMELEGYEDVD